MDVEHPRLEELRAALRASADQPPPRPTAALAEVLAAGLPSAPNRRRRRGWRRPVAAVSATLAGLTAKLALSAAAATAAVVGAAAIDGPAGPADKVLSSVTRTADSVLPPPQSERDAEPAPPAATSTDPGPAPGPAPGSAASARAGESARAVGEVAHRRAPAPSGAATRPARDAETVPASSPTGRERRAIPPTPPRGEPQERRSDYARQGRPGDNGDIAQPGRTPGGSTLDDLHDNDRRAPTENRP